ncbi:MAG: hypothetical protein WDZ35_11490 [Crocinitomicaceae bacterium]
MFSKILLLFLSITLVFGSFADSPLTSTPFYKAYLDKKIVKRAKENGLDKKVIKYLGKSKHDAALKIAAINAVGWGKEGTTKKFEESLLKKRKGLDTAVFNFLREVPEKAPVETEQTKLLTSDDLMCWTYLQAMEDYFHPEKCMSGAFFCFVRNEKSMAHATVFALIACQNSFDYDWCKIYQLGQLYLVETDYEENKLSTEAVKIILDYLNLYGDSCKE